MTSTVLIRHVIHLPSSPGALVHQSFREPVCMVADNTVLSLDQVATSDSTALVSSTEHHHNDTVPLAPF